MHNTNLHFKYNQWPSNFLQNYRRPRSCSLFYDLWINKASVLQGFSNRIAYILGISVFGQMIEFKRVSSFFYIHGQTTFM